VIDRPRLPRYYESFLFFKMKDLDDDDYYTPDTALDVGGVDFRRHAGDEIRSR
jgi:hypothetical protein